MLKDFLQEIDRDADTMTIKALAVKYHCTPEALHTLFRRHGLVKPHRRGFLDRDFCMTHSAKDVAFKYHLTDAQARYQMKRIGIPGDAYRVYIREQRRKYATAHTMDEYLAYFDLDYEAAVLYNRRWNIHCKKRAETDLHAQIRGMVECNYSTARIVEQLGCSPSYVLSLTGQYGLAMRSLSIVTYMCLMRR